MPGPRTSSSASGGGRSGRERQRSQLSKKSPLGRRSAESIGMIMVIAADATLVKAKSLRIDGEEFFLRVPVLTCAMHATVKDARVEFAAPRIANAIQHTISFRGELLAQALLEIWRHTPGQTQHVHEGPGRAAFFRPLQQTGNVCTQSGNRRRDADAHLNSGIRQFLHRRETRARRRRERLDGASDVRISKRN